MSKVARKAVTNTFKYDKDGALFSLKRKKKQAIVARCEFSAHFFFCPSSLPFGLSTVLSTRGPAGTTVQKVRSRLCDAVGIAAVLCR